MMFCVQCEQTMRTPAGTGCADLPPFTPAQQVGDEIRVAMPRELASGLHDSHAGVCGACRGSTTSEIERQRLVVISPQDIENRWLLHGQRGCQPGCCTYTWLVSQPFPELAGRVHSAQFHQNTG